MQAINAHRNNRSRKCTHKKTYQKETKKDKDEEARNKMRKHVRSTILLKSQLLHEYEWTIKSCIKKETIDSLPRQTKPLEETRSTFGKSPNAAQYACDAYGHCTAKQTKGERTRKTQQQHHEDWQDDDENLGEDHLCNETPMQQQCESLLLATREVLTRSYASE